MKSTKLESFRKEDTPMISTERQRSLWKRAARMILVLLFAGGMAPAQLTAQETEHTLQKKPPEPARMSGYYMGRTVTTGIFPGRLVCLRCDTMPTPENIEVCKKEGHRHALAMDGDTMIHPLLFENEELFKQVGNHDWYRKKVAVSGRYYSDTGFILVSNITVKEE